MAKAEKEKKRWLVIVQPINADQSDASTMHVAGCWTSTATRKQAFQEANEHIDEWLERFGPCKISLFEGDMWSQHFLGKE